MSACNLLNTSISLPLDAELIAAGENEVAASKRIIERLCNNCRQLFDVIVADALYMEGPFINYCVSKGKDVVIVLKDNYSTLLEDADGLFSQIEPKVWQLKDKTVEVWDIEGFTAETINVPLRVLKAVETHIEKYEKDGQILERSVTKNWFWATTVPISRLTTEHLWKLAHSRWQIENNIFNTLGQHWSLNHCYKHEPAAMVNFVLMLFIAFTLLECFYKRNIKEPMRKRIKSLIAMANQLYSELGADVGKKIRSSGAGPPLSG